MTYANGLYAAAVQSNSGLNYVFLSADGMSWWVETCVPGSLQDQFYGIAGFPGGQIFVIAQEYLS